MRTPDSAPATVGRFAPSPSGPLHAGSLVAALASYLDARAQGGLWRVRIEDIDPPREQPGATTTILRQLEAHGLHWDGPVTYQSQHATRYQAVLDQLSSAGLTYHCDCTRKQIRQRGGGYDGYCRSRNLAPGETAIRLVNHNPVTRFEDAFQGQVKVPATWAAQDFVLRRKDGLWAYQLAVVCDDYLQGITDIVRGADLLEPTAWQLTLWQQLTQLGLTPRPRPRLLHVPLITDLQGRKLSKQNHAPALAVKHPGANLRSALASLGLDTQQLGTEQVPELLVEATELWAERFSLARI